MKKVYEAPAVEIERYELDKSIAANCNPVIDLGPGGVNGQETCDYFGDIWGRAASTYALRAAFYNDGTCTCYTTGGGENYFTS